MEMFVGWCLRTQGSRSISGGDNGAEGVASDVDGGGREAGPGLLHGDGISGA